MEVNKAKYIISSPSISKCPAPDRPEYAFIGRSNVGKSSLINLLTNQNSLAKVSSSPGKTVMINHFLINGNAHDEGGWYLVDLPGYGYAKRSKAQREQWKKVMTDYFEKRENLVTIFVLVDSRLSPQAIDLEFLGHLGEIGVPFNIVFTKADKNSQADTSKNTKTFIGKMREDWEYIPKTFVTSTVKRSGRKEILAYVEELNQQYKSQGNQLLEH
ncbi:YihA family ribosome biogenesis GTP-binding protein [Taibaiella sp. KBW10]|uniref:ribosome biogenesis GTP-binding protein YihA/YsxC n=1 Tax=Taibaiella sp. KBW10 TaxID=2153357 RepID=UPI000F5A6628|nr:ribosome biogenesis GTP-binding protein YihA/YsxC [Taibaiella sp. KBW10]RQO32308.1 YihA family ribosome biogenesis GTP-binding protein [Taibaiella sp. KBW10]